MVARVRVAADRLRAGSTQALPVRRHRRIRPRRHRSGRRYAHQHACLSSWADRIRPDRCQRITAADSTRSRDRQCQPNDPPIGAVAGRGRGVGGHLLGQHLRRRRSCSDLRRQNTASQNPSVFRTADGWASSTAIGRRSPATATCPIPPAASRTFSRHPSSRTVESSSAAAGGRRQHQGALDGVVEDAGGPWPGRRRRWPSNQLVALTGATGSGTTAIRWTEQGLHRGGAVALGDRGVRRLARKSIAFRRDFAEPSLIFRVDRRVQSSTDEVVFTRHCSRTSPPPLIESLHCVTWVTGDVNFDVVVLQDACGSPAAPWHLADGDRGRSTGRGGRIDDGDPADEAESRRVVRPLPHVVVGAITAAEAGAGATRLVPAMSAKTKKLATR